MFFALLAFSILSIYPAVNYYKTITYYKDLERNGTPNF
jgi:hypothetical protein